MPIYEYQCTNCEHQLEALQKISDGPLKDCPACEKPKLEKLVSAASFRLKGSGWYETDFKTGNKKQLAESDSKAPKEASTEKSGNSDSSGNKEASSSSGTEKAKSKTGKTDSSVKGSGAGKSKDSSSGSSSKTS
ncbi:MAG: FmdB family transcriptional regulator [SAR86 cluster bacterium]|uniref:FmdB family transcriptional regulator n=1 Tax=SAR86 cluster bacterium TaxID=2030880 RepID=A0A2A5B8J8_9GAMM|nr:MAG: FmdB family transcriptional regulator [SAR86 cluster bacterium]